MLLGVEITNFDIFDKDKIGMLAGESDSDVMRLRNLNALIGRNNTGKTSFIDAMSFVKDVVTGNSAEASTIKGRPGFVNLINEKDKPAVFKIYFKLQDKENKKSQYIQYELSIAPGKFGSPFIESEKVLISDKTEDGYKLRPIMDMKAGKGVISGNMTQINDKHQTALSIYGQISSFTELSRLYREISRWFFCKFSSDENDRYFTDGNAPGGHRHLNSHGTNMLNVLQYIRQSDEAYYEHIMDEINDKMPMMKKKKNLPQALTSSPDKLFLYMLLLRDRDPHSTIFIETPDKDLYHDMVDVLSDDMRDFSIKNKYCQIVFSTHNPYIVESMNPKEIWVFSRTFDKEEGDVKISCAGEDKLVAELFEQGVGMGAIWYGGHLDADDPE